MAYSIRILVVFALLAIHSTAVLAMRCGDEYDTIAGEGEAVPESGAADLVGVARFGHLATMAEFLVEMDLPTPFVDARHMAIEASARSNDEKAAAHAALYDEYRARVDAFFAANVEDAAFRESGGRILKDYYNHPPLSSVGDFELPGWFDIDGHRRPNRVENWEDLFSKAAYAPAWDIAMNTVKNTDGFKEVLGTPRYKDPNVRLETVTRMQYAYALSALSHHLGADLLRRTSFDRADGSAEGVISSPQVPDRVDIP
ncbi:MAG: hypothetical protein KDD51_09970 [Bdellovibrionales bacterium]|nr:hypothetical protein [Bdellovibrionales bacterium]